MSSIDDRIVQMQFDNKQFEDKAATTLGTLDKLKAGLNFGGAQKGLSDLTAAGKNFSLDGIATALDGVAGKFTAMGAVAFTVIQNIVNRAVDAGIQLAKSLSLDQVISGFREYETNMNSIQTILANTKSKGSTLDDVNAALEQLNEYSDKTIYNFSEMARNIGTFTAAGVGLDDSVNAIKGIANLAAISGSNSQQASTAMYQLSQALAAGKVNLMDWNSVVNAGMGGEIFKKALFETGKAMGTITNVPLTATFEEWEKAGGTFREQMQSGWLTADVLKTSLGAFSGELDASTLTMLGFSEAAAAEMVALGQLGVASATEVKTLTQLIGTVKESIGSGWSKSFKIIFGDFEQAKELFTSVNAAIGGFVGANADARNELLGGWNYLGGRDKLIAALGEAFKGLGNVLGTIRDAFREVFPAMDAFDLVALTDKFAAFVDKVTPSKNQLMALKNIFEAVFSVVAIGIGVIKEVASAIGDLLGDNIKIGNGQSGVLGFLNDIAKTIIGLRETLLEDGGLARIFASIKLTVDKFFDGLTFDNFVEKLGEVFTRIYATIANVLGFDPKPFADSVEGVVDRVGERFGFLGTIASGVVSVFQFVADKFGTIKDAFSGFGTFLKDTFGNLPGQIADILSDSDYDVALDTVNTGLFAGLLVLFKTFGDSVGSLGDLGGITSGITDALGGLTGTLEAMQTKLKSEALLSIAKAVGVLTASAVVLALIDSAALTKSMSAMAVGLGQLVLAMGILNTISGTSIGAAKMALLGSSLMFIATSMLVLAAAVKILSTMSWEELSKGLLGIGVLLGAIVLAVKPLSANSSGMITAGLGLVALGVALNILALAVKSFAEMSWEEMAKGLVGVSVALLAIGVAMNLMPPTTILSGAGLIGVATAMVILGGAMKVFASMSWGEMAKGMVALAGGLVIIGLAMNLMPPTMVLSAAGLVLVSIAVTSLAASILAISKMSWSALGRGLAGLAGALVILTAATYAMSGSLVGAVALVILSAALLKLSDAIKSFASIGWLELASGLAVMAISLITITALSAILGLVSPLVAAFGLALAVVGVGMLAFGAGAFLLASAFALVAGAGTAGIATLVSTLQVLLDFLPLFLDSLGTSMLLLVQKILDAAPGIIDGFSEILKSVFQMLIDNIPMLAETLKTLILEALKVVAEVAPEVIATGFEILLNLLKGIRDNIKEIVTVAADIITNFIDGLTEKLPQIIDSGFNFVVALVKGIVEKFLDVANAGGDIVGEFIDGIAGKIFDVVGAGVKTVTDWISGVAGKAVDIANAGKDLIVDFLEGLIDSLGDIVSAGIDTVGKFIDGIGDAISDVYDAGVEMASEIISGLIKGLGNGAKKVKDKLLSVVGDAWDAALSFLGISSPSRLAMEMGGYIVDGLALGLDNSDAATNSALSLADRTTKALSESMAMIPNALSGVGDFNPVIAPVMDLTDVARGAAKIAMLMSDNGKVIADLSYNQAAMIAASSAALQNSDTPVEAPLIREIKFEQHNYSPEALSPAEIYRQTRNQIATAKEELEVL